ncbi:MAG: GNAT family N-acetyltransferase [Flavobacteriaceae bacterium]
MAHSFLDERLILRPLHSNDDQQLGELIQRVLEEMKAPKTGTAYADPYLFSLSNYYTHPRRKYYVIADSKVIYGGGGFGDLPGADPSVCEIQKMYFDAALRGRGWGEHLITYIMSEAKKLAYNRAYIETLESMTAARALYKKLGFKTLNGPLGSTGHSSCPIHLIKDL